jgi:hypothetical protein
MGTVGLKATVRARLALTVKVKRTGRVKPPNLDMGEYTDLGKLMVRNQKERWAKAINAEGNAAKPLSVKYIFEKRAYTGNTRPKRDMKMTGETIANFQLRKARDGVIRAENTNRLARQKAMRAQGYDQMIGFSGDEQTAIFKKADTIFGEKMKRAWVPING